MDTGVGTHQYSPVSQRPLSRPGEGFTSSAQKSMKILSSRPAMDSDVLASSDDETDTHGTAVRSFAEKPQHLMRRSSWLNDSQRKVHRQSSYSGNATFSPSSSNPPSAAADANPWNPVVASSGRTHSSTGSFPWGNAIWNNDVQKCANARFNEAVPSPTSTAPVGITKESQGTPPPRRDSSSDGAIPFAIPLHPTLKTYRSQSYSVGQLDQELTNSKPRPNVQHNHGSRNRGSASYSGLQHRSSRPSMFGDFSPDTSILGQLREVDDDDELSTTSSETGIRPSHGHSRTIEKLAMENAILRQQAFLAQSSQNGVPGALGTLGSEVQARGMVRHIQPNENALEEADEILSVSSDQRIWDSHQCVGTFLNPLKLYLQCRYIT